MIVIGIDPSYSGRCGWAMVQASDMGREEKLLTAGISAGDPEPGVPFTEKVVVTIEGLLRKVIEYISDTSENVIVAIEVPEDWGNYGSKMAMKKGVLVNLAFLCGSIFWALRGVEEVYDIVLYKPSQWKGQVPKDVTAQRIVAKYGYTPKSFDESDAIGIADHYIREVQKKEQLAAIERAKVAARIPDTKLPPAGKMKDTGVYSDTDKDADGWYGRFLRAATTASTPPQDQSPDATVGESKTLPEAEASSDSGN